MPHSLLTSTDLTLKPIDDTGSTNPAPEAGSRHHKTADHCPVLIVEDDADLRDMMAQILTLEGFSAATVANGREALEFLEERDDTPEVILLDLMMPVMDGWEFRRHQRANPALSGVPVIILSALDPERASHLDAEAFLKKPLDFDRLLQLIRHYCH